MPRLRTICTHPARVTIDDGLVTGQSLRAISAEYGVSKSAVDRHKESHLPTPLTQQGADLAVMTYYNALRIQGWIGDLAFAIEHELFAEDSLKVTLRQYYSRNSTGSPSRRRCGDSGNNCSPCVSG